MYLIERISFTFLRFFSVSKWNVGLLCKRNCSMFVVCAFQLGAFCIVPPCNWKLKQRHHPALLPPPHRSLCPRKARNKFSNQQRTKQALCTINCAPLTSCSTSLQHILYPSGCDSENQEAACCCLFNKRLLAANTFNRMQFVDCGQSLHFPRFSTHPAKRPTLSTRN